MTDDDDGKLLADLRGMWERRDPVPDGLAASVILALATADVAREYELLTLSASADRLAGVRGSEVRTLTFTAGAVTVMLRVSALPDGRRRVDGWVSPAATYDVVLLAGDHEARTTSTDQGRFELPDVPAGAVTVRLRGTPPDAPGGEPLRLRTPSFEC
jgi:hypothetical protein